MWAFDADRDARQRRELVAACERLAARDDLELMGAQIGDEAIVPAGFPVDGIYVRWVTAPPLPRAGGELNWLAIGPGFGWSTEPLVHADHTPAEVELLQSLIIIEQHPDSGDFIHVLASEDEQLWLYDRGAAAPLALDHAGYVAAQLQLLGLGGWLHVFAEPERAVAPPGSLAHAHVQAWRGEAVAHARRVLADARAIFPAADLAFLEARLRELEAR